ncbi:MAG TPA: glycosyltransferase family 39 protein [Anaerolineae bacterium]|nr:glycosyltransferase family 39 protein [Anaerolineae bacterium]HQK15285.1 glycosyltransferase family 39 protein [Anaerolineae bacterium]
MSSAIRSVSARSVLYLCLILGVYTALLLPTVNRQGISWDEQTDIDIARTYLRPGGWLSGSNSDPSQTRLPMAVVAVVYTLLHTDDLFTGRIVSCLVGTLTLIGVYVVCRRDFDRHTGLLAAALLATSPFFLSFARVAFTETDVFVACAFVWLWVAMSHLGNHGTLGWATITAVVLGLALSGKFTVVVIFPAIIFHILFFARDRTTPTTRLATTRLKTRDLRNGAALLALMIVVILLGWLNLNSLKPEWREEALLRFHFILALGGWVAVLVWAARHRDKTVSPLLMVGFILVLALGTFMVVPPEHLTNPTIIRSLFDRFEREMAWNPAFMGEAATLHLACVLFKSSPLIGAGLLASVIAAARQWKGRHVLRLPVLMVGCYFLGLILLPLAQTFYMVPLLPILAILAADQWRRLMSRRKRVALGFGAAAALVLAVDLILCYPDFNLNGYQWVGARYIGNRATIGYRSIVQTPSDGVQQMVQWVNANAKEGARVVVYAYPWHIVEATCPDPRVRFIRGQYNSVRLRPDYVIVHINHTIRQSWAAYFTGDVNTTRAESIFWEPYDATWLHSHYTKIATVPRAFGIEMASVWKRN